MRKERATYRTALYDPFVDRAAESLRNAWMATDRHTEDVLVDILVSWAALAEFFGERNEINTIIDRIEERYHVN